METREILMKSDRVSVVFERIEGDKIRVTTSSWDDAKMILRKQVLEAAMIGKGRLGWSGSTSRSPTFFGPGWSTHMMGSCRMGSSDDGTSCVDPFGKLWGCENIYVVGNAVFAVSNARNPTLSTEAMSLRTADAIITALRS